MAFEPRNHEQAADYCRALAERIDWSLVILDRWPTPLAFEYGRLRDELARGQMLAAMFQLKDCAEVLVKLVVSVAGRLLIEQGSQQQRTEARRFLLARKPPSLGDWVQDGVKLVTEAYRLDETLWRPWAPVLGLLRKPGRNLQPTALWRELEQLVGWRNAELGHNALRLDMLDFTEDLDERLTAFNAGLAQHVAAWDGVTLAVSLDPDRTLAFIGHAALEAAQPALLEHLGNHALAPLRLDRDGHTLWLGPYVCLRRHSRDDEVGCYVLNKRIGKRSQAQLNLLDYRTGDTGLAGHATGEPSLLAELDSLPEETSVDGGGDAPAGDLGDDEVRDFLDGISFQREYVAPEYLRRALRDFLDPAARTRGLFWLCAPADVGKTLFAYGLATRGSLREVLGGEQPAPLWDDLEAIVVAIRREYRCTPAALSSDVQTALGRSGDRKFLGLERFLYDEAFKNDRPGAFCAWLERMRNEATAHLGPSARFLLVLDGLDELPPLDETVEGGSIADLLPPADRLPERVFLLLTSRGRDPARPADDCPTAVYTALDNAFAASTDALRARYALDPRTDAEYRAVLQTFFEQRLTTRYPQEAERAALFERVLEHGEHRFKSLSYYTALLASGAIGPADLAELSAEPLQQHLAALETWEPPRKFALIRRILLELAAAEQAHRAEIALMEPAPVIDRAWLGLDLLELAWRVGYPATRPRELDPRFLTALYSIQELIRSYRGAAATTSRFALGLKGMVEQLETLEGWETTQTLERLLNDALGDFQSSNNHAVQMAVLVRAGGPAAALSIAGLRARCWAAVKDIFNACLENAIKYLRNYQTTESLRLCITAQSLATLANDPDEPADVGIGLKNNIAGSFMERGLVRIARDELPEAIADYNQSIRIREKLRAELEPEDRWEISLQLDLALGYLNRASAKGRLKFAHDLMSAINDLTQAIKILGSKFEKLGYERRKDLANAYVIRGNIKQLSSSLNLMSAITDYDLAIEIMKALRGALKSNNNCEVDLQNHLAMAYMNRGNAKQITTDYSAALNDYDNAILLMEELRDELEPKGHWEIILQDQLATAYMNRGNIKKGATKYGAALNDLDSAIELMEKLRSNLESEGRWEVGLQEKLAKSYLIRGNAKRAVIEYGPIPALDDYSSAIALLKAMQSKLEPQGRWTIDLRDELVRAYLHQGDAQEQAGYLPEAIATWKLAMEVCYGLIEQGWLLAYSGLQSALLRIFSGYITLNNWLCVAHYLLTFIRVHQQLEAMWAEQHGELEPPWRDIVGRFARAVHALNPDQRAALLEALGEKAEVVKRAFGWE